MTKREARLVKNAKIRVLNKAKYAVASRKIFMVTQVMWGKKPA